MLMGESRKEDVAPCSPSGSMGSSSSTNFLSILKEDPDFISTAGDMASTPCSSVTEAVSNLGDSKGKPGRKRRRDAKCCAVCGDKALGFNFGAITCESCKAFFRRNAIKSEVPPCMFSESCKIERHTRRFCTQCRLKKCYESNMRKEFILGEEERQVRQKKVCENRQKRLKTVQHNQSDVQSSHSNSLTIHSGDDHSPSDVPQDSDFQLPTSCPTVQAVMGDLIGSVHSSMTSGMTQNGSGDWTGVTRNQPPLNGSKMTHDCVEGEISLNDELSKEGQAWFLSRAQWDAIFDLRHAYDVSFLNMVSDRAPDQGNFTLNNLINTSEFIVRKLINFAKKLSDFSVLSQDCQIALLKGVVLNTLFLRSANHYDVEKDVWITPNGEIPTRILQMATGHSVLYEEHAKYCRNFKAIVGRDSSLIALMQVLCLFSPERPSIKNRQQVSSIHDRYLLLLKHYLEARTGYSEARHLLPQVLSNLSELQRLTDNHGSLLLQLDPNKVDPLMLEVFSLNDNLLLQYQQYHHPTIPAPTQTLNHTSSINQSEHSAGLSVDQSRVPPNLLVITNGNSMVTAPPPPSQMVTVTPMSSENLSFDLPSDRNVDDIGSGFSYTAALAANSTLRSFSSLGKKETNNGSLGYS